MLLPEQRTNNQGPVPNTIYACCTDSALPGDPIPDVVSVATAGASESATTPSVPVLDYHHADFYYDCVPDVVCVAIADVAEMTAQGPPFASGATKARTAKASAPAHSAGDDAEENSASAHSAENEEESDELQEDSRRQPSARRTTKAANSLAHGNTSHTTTGSSQLPFTQDRRAQPHSQGRRQQRTARHDACATPTTTHPASLLSIDHPNLANNTSDDRSTGHPSIGHLSSRLHLALGRAPRADHADQGSSLESRSPTIQATRSCIDGQDHQSTAPFSYRFSGTDKTPCEKRMNRCAYCGRPHFSARCNLYTSVSTRLERLRQLDHCLLCLRGGHWSNACPRRQNVKCLHCANPRPHHVSLCRAYTNRRTCQADNAPAAPQEPARTAQAAQRKKAKPKVRTAPAATHSVANGANSSGRSTAIGTFPPVLNNFCRSDQPSSVTPPKKRDNPRSEKNRSAADPSPAQSPSSLLSSLGHKDALCAKQWAKEPFAHRPPSSRGYSDAVISVAAQAQSTAHSLPSTSATYGPLPSSDVFACVSELVNLLGAKIDAVCEVIASLHGAAAKPPTTEPTEASHRRKPRKHRKRKSTR